MKYQLVNWFPKFKIGFEKSTHGLSVVYDWYLPPRNDLSKSSQR